MKKIGIFLFASAILLVGCRHSIDYDDHIEDLKFEEVKSDDGNIYKYRSIRKINEMQYDEIEKFVNENNYEYIASSTYSKQPVELYKSKTVDNKCIYIMVEFHGFVEFIISDTCDVKEADISEEGELNHLNIEENMDMYDILMEGLSHFKY